MMSELNVRVYYEDTDFSGLVYHASYIRFMERGRTEWLRNLGLQHGDLAANEKLAFALSELKVRFLRSAKVDDLLRIVTKNEEVQGAVLRFEQTVYRCHEILCDAEVSVVTMKNGRAARPPRSLVERIRAQI